MTLTIPDNVSLGLHIGHAAHDPRGIIAEGQTRSVVADMAKPSTLLKEDESIVH